ncbi:MAG: glycosyl hydrolase-related protein [Candidatus Bathyarchaeia archaeon]
MLDKRCLHYTRSLSKVFRIRLADFVSVFHFGLQSIIAAEPRDSDDIIMRFYETSGEDTKAVISLSETSKSAEETFLMENGTRKISIQDKTIEMPISKHEIKTIRMIMQA